MKGKVLSWSLFIDTAKTPGHFTESTFSAVERHKAQGTGTAKESQSGAAIELWERRHVYLPVSVPCVKG